MRIVSLIFIAIFTFIIVLVVKRPELFKDFWLWLVGFSGLILHGLQMIWIHMKGLVSGKIESAIKKEKEVVVRVQNKKSNLKN